MATSVTSLGLKAAADKVIIAAGPDIEFIKLFATDFSVDYAKKGDAVAVPVLSATTENFGSGAGYAHGTNKIAPASVSLSSHKKSTFAIGDVDALENELDPIWDKLAPLSAEAIAGDVVDAVMALPTVAAATSTVSQALNGLSSFIAARAAVKALNTYKLGECALLLSTAAYAELLGALPASVIGTGDVVQSGAIARFLGFKAVVESPNLSTTSNAWGYVVPTGAIAIAARLVKPLRAGGNLLEAGSITDDTTGFVMGTRVVVDADQGEVFWSVDCLFGAALSKNTTNGAPGYVALVTPSTTPDPDPGDTPGGTTTT